MLRYRFGFIFLILQCFCISFSGCKCNKEKTNEKKQGPIWSPPPEPLWVSVRNYGWKWHKKLTMDGSDDEAIETVLVEKIFLKATSEPSALKFTGNVMHGEKVKFLDIKSNGRIKIRNSRGEEGWVWHKFIKELKTEELMKFYYKNEKNYKFLVLYQSPSMQNGEFVTLLERKGPKVLVKKPDNSESWVDAKEIKDFERWKEYTQ